MPLTEAQIKHMANRFLGWTVPENFSPDAGISFERLKKHGGGFFPLPVGTNLLDASQAEAMVRYLVDGVLEVEKSEFAWLIEAPGPKYLATRNLGKYEFYWTAEHDKALRFYSEAQADVTMMAVRESEPHLFAFEAVLSNARAVEHGWVALPAPKAA